MKPFKPIVALSRCSRYQEEEVRFAIEAIFASCGGLPALVQPGQKVLLKPNMLAAVTPAEAVTTHPLVVRVVAQLLIEAGAKVYIGDSPGSGSQEKAHALTGCQAVMEETGAKLLLLEEVCFKQAGQKGERLIPLAGELDQVDLIFNLAKLKTHSLTGMTAAVKNLYGCIPGRHKKLLHRDFPLPLDFSRLLIDLCLAVKPAFSLIDAVVAMEGVGPRRGKPRQAGLLLGSCNPFAVDAVAAAAAGFLPGEVTTTTLAEKMQLPGSKLSAIELRGATLDEIKIENFDRGVVSSGRVSKLLLNFPLAWFRNFNYARRPYPAVNRDLCSGCGSCAENCPLQIITMQNYLPDLELYECIRCYCCQEHCPEGAITLTGKAPG